MNESTPEMERRKYVRLTSQNVVKCEVYRITNGEDAEKQESTSKNISAGGLLFETKKQYDIGEVLKLEINLPGWQKFKPEFFKPDQLSGEKPLVALANVVRVESVSDGTYDVGVCLAGIDEGHQMAINKYIDQRLRESARGE